jgi:ribosomal-protein-alanine N-acetyltransferase
MEVPLPVGKPESKLNLRSPRRAQEETAYLDLVNRAYQEVPNAVTKRPPDLHLQNHRYILAYQGEQLVGAYELDLSQKPAELVTLAVDPAFRRQGLGRALLRSALDSLGPKASSCVLTVSTADTAALSLFQSEGFVQTELVSDWYQVV